LVDLIVFSFCNCFFLFSVFPFLFLLLSLIIVV
jgi:hypothetical protein